MREVKETLVLEGYKSKRYIKKIPKYKVDSGDQYDKFHIKKK